MIRRIRIDGYKSFKNFEVKLSPLSVIFGPNATGKSNFLDALQLLSRMANNRTLKEAFEPPYRGRPIESFSYPAKGIEGLIGQDNVSFAISVDIELSELFISRINKEIGDMRKGLEKKMEIKNPVRL
jgi:AAA15 family ATPase/GTPase